MSDRAPKRLAESAHHARRLLLAAALVLCAGSAGAQQSLVDGSVSYGFTDQSMWGPGDAFVFDDDWFVGIDSNPGPVVIGSGSGDRVSVPTPIGTYSVDPYYQFDTDFKLGVELGASIDSGSVDGNLDFAVEITAPDRIRLGESFSLRGSATPLGTSGFVTRSPTAEAYVDGVLEAYLGGYARFDYVRPGFISDQDLRWGNRGFTTNDDRNRPYATVQNIVERQEIIGVNRDGSGVIRYLGGSDLTDGDLLYDELGKGSSVSLGPISLTAGSIDVVASGALDGGSVVGAGNDTVASMNLDIDQLLLGTPALGQSLSHDWGAIDYALGYDLVDLDANLDILLQQDFELTGEVLVELSFSSDVWLEGVGLTDRYLGPIDRIPLVTLESGGVAVDATVLVEALLTNDTSLGFVGSLDTLLLQAYAELGWNISGNSGARGVNVGPVYSASAPIGLGDIRVYRDTFSLGQAPVGSFSFQLVPEPGTLLMLSSGLLGLHVLGRRRSRRQGARGLSASPRP